MKAYQICSKTNVRKLTQVLASNSQIILPMVELLESSQLAVEQLMEGLGRATLQAVLQISAAGVAGEIHNAIRA